MITIPAILESWRSLKDRSYKITFETNELPPEKVGEISSCTGQWVYLAIKREDFKTAEIEALNNLKSEYEDTGKPPSQRLRAVLYRIWEQDNEGFRDHRMHYEHHMDKVINHFKGKLP